MEAGHLCLLAIDVASVHHEGSDLHGLLRGATNLIALELVGLVYFRLGPFETSFIPPIPRTSIAPY